MAFVPGWPEGPGPESIATSRGYGFRARRFAAPRNDDRRDYGLLGSNRFSRPLQQSA
jgi:hypothetical protein